MYTFYYVFHTRALGGAGPNCSHENMQCAVVCTWTAENR